MQANEDGSLPPPGLMAYACAEALGVGTPSMNSANYRFLRARAGISYFALVAVDISPADTGGQVHLRLGEAHDTSNQTGEVSATGEAGWARAAMQGARRVLDRFASRGLNGHSTVTITRIAGSPLDTRDDVVEVAAAMATARALGESRFSAEPVWRDGRWDVDLRIDAQGRTQGQNDCLSPPKP